MYDRWFIKIGVGLTLLYGLVLAVLLITDRDETQASISITAGITNAAPAFTAGPSDGGSSASTPTTPGANVTFTATANDANGEQYYLAICKTNAVTPGDDAAPTCDGGSWAISTATNDDAQASVNYATSGSDVTTNVWYAFVCDKVSGGGSCSSSSQGSGDNGSPFVMTGSPVILSSVKAVEYSDNADETPEPGERLSFIFEIVDGSDDLVTAVFCDTTFTHGTKTCDSEELCRLVASTWEDQTSSATSDLLRGVHFASTSVGWAVGENGAIVETGDGGLSWATNTSGTANDLDSVHFLDSSNGWAVGESGTIRNTTDGGATSWTTSTSGTSEDLNGVSFVNSSNGWAVGNSGTILKYNGSSWASQDSTTSSNLTAVDFVDASNGWAVGAAGTIVKHNGTSWAIQNTPIGSTLLGVSFVDSSNGWAVGELGQILVTSNGGTTWTAQTSGTTNDLYGVHFTSSSIGWAVGVTGTILATSNGGTTWTTQASGTSNTLYEAYFQDSGNGWAVGASGTILHNGPAWAAQTSGTSTDLNDVMAADTDDVWVVGDSGLIRATSNGGASWAAQTSNTANDLAGIHCADTSNCWAVGASGTITHTSDGGATAWSTQTSGTANYLHDAFFASTTVGWAVGGASTIVKTTNGGTNWSSQTSPESAPLKEVYCTDTSTCWAAGESGKIIATTNGGTNWSSQTSGTANDLWSIFFADANNGWAVGASGTILNTTNGGTGWSSQTSPISDRLSAVYFVDSNTGWISADSGAVLKTNDGGTSWDVINNTQSSENLNGLWFVDSDEGWAAGDNGDIVRTGSGGTQSGICHEADTAAADLYIKSPTVHGNKAYTIHLFDENDDADDGSDESQNIVVEDTVPTFIEYLINDSPNLIAGGTDDMDFSVVVRDLNGDDDITAVEGIFFDDTNVTNSCTADHNDCYIDATCTLETASGTDTDRQADCQVTLYYNANSGTNWEVHANPTDGNGKETGFQDSNANITVNALLAIDSTVGLIAYGTVAQGGTSSGIETSVGNAGNQQTDYTVSGSDMCVDYPTCSGNSIGKAQQKWDPDSGFDWDTEGHTLLTTPNTSCTLGVDCDAGDGCNNEDILVRDDGTSTTENNQSIHWKIRVPGAQAGGSYTGENIYGAIATSSCTGTP